MSERHALKLTLANRAKALAGVEIALSKSLTGKPWTLELRERTRTDEQNDGLHGLIEQIIKQRPIHNGLKLDKALWKATFMQAMGEEIRFVPTLDGKSVFPIGLSTSKLGVSRFSELIEFVLAWCATEGLTVEYFDGGARDAEGPKKPSARAAA